MTIIETFAEQYRLKVTRDECNDRVIKGAARAIVL
jgi:hypothetical protein